MVDLWRRSVREVLLYIHVYIYIYIYIYTVNLYKSTDHGQWSISGGGRIRKFEYRYNGRVLLGIYVYIFSAAQSQIETKHTSPAATVYYWDVSVVLL